MNHTPMNSDIFQHPSLIGKYTITQKLGHGTQAKMFLAQSAAGKLCAIKAYNLATIPNWKANELMEREIETLRTLDVEHVPHCLEVIDANASETPYIFVVQEFVSGSSLQDMIGNGHRFSIQDILNIMLDLTKILLTISQNYHIVHRDIKPSNIMIDDTGAAWLVDFGSVVKAVKHEGGSTIAGTAGYMSPEQCLGDAVPVSDVYSLGMSIIHLLTGTEPFEFLQENLRPIYHDKLPTNVPAWLVSLLDRMIEPFYMRRATIAEVYRQVSSKSANDVFWTPTQDKQSDHPEASVPAKLHGDMVQAPLILRISSELVFIITSQLSCLIYMICLIPKDKILVAIGYYVFAILYLAVVLPLSRENKADSVSGFDFFNRY